MTATRRIIRNNEVISTTTKGTTTMNTNTALAIAMGQAGITTEQPIRDRLAALTLTTDTGDAQHDRALSYLVRGLSFIGERLASDYVRAKDALRNPKSGSPAPEQKDIDACKEKARLFNSFIVITGTDIDPRNIADFLCGLKGKTEPTEKEVIQFAELNECSMEQAHESVRVKKLEMLSRSQINNMRKHGQFQEWLRDVEQFGPADDDTPVLDLLQTQLVEQYKKAAEYSNHIGKFLVESYAKQFGVTLPRWTDILPRWTEAQDKKLELVQRRQIEVEEARAQQEAEAERQLTEQFGNF